MRASLTSILTCPVCRAGDWALSAAARNDREVLSGQLHCRSCSRSFELLNGAVDLVVEEQLPEMLRIDRDRAGQSDQTIFESKRRGEFSGDLRKREEIYRHESSERTDFLFTCLQYDTPATRTVLDLGCGEPFFASGFARLGFNVIALDYVVPRLDLAHEYFERDSTYFERLLALMTNIPLRDQSVDIVFSHASLHHASSSRQENSRWFDPNNMAETLREVRRILKPDGLFLVSGEGEYPEELDNQHRELEREAQRTGCYEAFYKISEYEQVFCSTGLLPNLWAQYSNDQNRLRVGTFRDSHYRQIVSPGDAVNTHSAFLLSAPALKRDLDACLGRWARMRPWPAGEKVPRSGGVLPIRSASTFVEGWHDVEMEMAGLVRWMGRTPAVIVFELDPAPRSWEMEVTLRACSLFDEFDTAVFVQRGGKTVAKNIFRQSAVPTPHDGEFEFAADLESGPTTIRCIRDGRLRISVYFNGDLLTILQPPSDREFHTCKFALPQDAVRSLNQITFEPSYALRPSDYGTSHDDRWLSCQVGNVRVAPRDGG